MVGIFSEWHPTLFRILQWLSPTGDYGIAYLHSFAKQAVAELLQRSEKDKLRSEEKSQGGDALESDYLSTFLAKVRRTPDAFSVDDAYYHMMSNLLAGGETTGISLTAAVYFLYKTPRSLERLRQEVEGMKTESLSPSNTTMKELSECQYLQAIIKETVRVFSPIGIGLPRVVPERGLTLAGRFFPENVCASIPAPSHAPKVRRTQHTKLIRRLWSVSALGSLAPTPQSLAQTHRPSDPSDGLNRPHQ